MKPFREQNYYDLLDLAPDAGADAVAKAYASAKRMFSADALGSYSLFDPAEREALLDRIDKAWRTLSDPASRARYDEETLGLVRAPANATPAPPKPPAFSYADLAVTDVTGAALRARREAIGLPLQEIAVTTRISIAYLQFIEEDHVKGLPHDAYLRGYLAQYARALGLDPHTVADGYLQHLRTLRGGKP
jgi:curved DNA-binding protein CbpA